MNTGQRSYVRRYPWVRPEVKQMTLAAGFLYREGVILCAETELTIGDLKSHGAKIMPFECPYGRIGIVCSGHFLGAVSTMQKIRAAVQALPSETHPLVAIEAILRREYQEIVWDRQPAPYRRRPQLSTSHRDSKQDRVG